MYVRSLLHAAIEGYAPKDSETIEHWWMARIFRRQRPSVPLPVYIGYVLGDPEGDLFHLYPRFDLKISPFETIYHDLETSIRVEGGCSQAFLENVSKNTTNSEDAVTPRFRVEELHFWYGVYPINLAITNATAHDIIVRFNEPVAQIHYLYN